MREKPFLKEHFWYILFTDSDGLTAEIRGDCTYANRKKTRTVLNFKLPDVAVKKFYMCEYCQQPTWISYRNYSCQHVRRHHPEACTKCESCNQLVETSLFQMHNKYCSATKAKSCQSFVRKLTVTEISTGQLDANFVHNPQYSKNPCYPTTYALFNNINVINLNFVCQ